MENGVPMHGKSRAGKIIIIITIIIEVFIQVKPFHCQKALL